MTRFGSAGTLALLFILSVAYQIPQLFQPLVMYDEGTVLCGAERVLRGDIPYRDFWSIYAPGQFVNLAFLFGVFGKTVLVERVYDLVIRGLAALVVFLILRDVVRLRVALLGWATSVVWLQFFGSPGYPVYPFLLLLLAAVYALLRYLSGGDRRHVAMAGAALGFAILFRHFLGATAGLLMAASIFALPRGSASETRPSWHPRSLARRLPAVFLLCAAAPPVAALLVLSLAGALPDMIDQLVVFPLTKFADYRSLPYPSLHLLFPTKIESPDALASHLRLSAEVLNFYIFPALCILGLAANAAVVIRTRRLDPISCVGIYLCVIGLVFLRQGSVRAETLHLLPGGVFAILASFLSHQQSRRAFGERLWPKVVSMCVAIYLLYPISLWLASLSEIRFSSVAPLSESYRAAADFVRERTRADDRLFVGVYNHDRIVANLVTLYFIVGRGYGSKYHELHPGAITTEEVQAEVIHELEQNGVEYLLLSNGWWAEPNQSRVDAGVDLLDEFIRNRFQPVMWWPSISVWMRSDGEWPEGRK